MAKIIIITGLLTATGFPLAMAITYIYIPELFMYTVSSFLGAITSIVGGYLFIAWHDHKIARQAEQERKEIQDQIDGAGI